MRATPLFVVGAPRSGTTLARQILRGFEGVYLPPDEFQILPAFVRAAEAGEPARALARRVEDSVFADHMRRRGIWPGVDCVEALVAGRPPAEAFRALTLELARREGVDRVTFWGDKTPENVFHLDLIDRLWPDSRVIAVVRDPRTTVLSMRRSWGRSLVRGAAIWRDAIRAAEGFRVAAGPRRLHTLSYEALTEKPEAELQRLAAWLETPFNPALLADVASEERWGGSTGARGVQKRPPEWEVALSARQIARVEEICLAEMRLCGFAPRFATRPRSPGGLELKLARAGDGLRVLKAYAEERGWRAALSYKLRQWRSVRRA